MGTDQPGMKNISIRHDFEVTGGYDPERDGGDPQWGRVAVTCRRCGEQRRVGVSPGELERLTGCRRKGSSGRWQQGDLLVRGGALDEFVQYLPDGRALTYNAGGHYHESDCGELVAFA
jgi:hypothetical protein